ncbi:MAG: HTH-type transcriptional repressor KstR2 [Syntrophorhabdus sp. PtaU1.Bin050]|jgi:AcrR family transcriptional regulator|nr:MAG: HTH-type transcriptional repressor KstR2 [Syntrophorhabdus sp. PtaU1.Bin050]
MNDDKKAANKKRVAIAKIAAEFFSKRGYAETSMEDIATAAKLSKGGIYHYFGSKTDVLYFVVDNFMELVLNGLEEELKGIDDGLEKVKRVIRRHVELYPKHTAEAKTLLNAVHNLPRKSFKNIVAKEREYFRVVDDALSSYLGASLGKNEALAITFILLGMCNSIYAWYDPHSAVGPSQLSDMMFNLLIDGIRGIAKKLPDCQTDSSG